jgi:hypothetical protein
LLRNKHSRIPQKLDDIPEVVKDAVDEGGSNYQVDLMTRMTSGRYLSR